MPAVQVAKQARRSIFGEMQFHAGVPALIAAEKSRQDALQRLRCRSHPQHSDVAGREGARPFAERVGFTDDHTRASEEVSAVLGELDRTSGPHEQLHAELALERPDLA